MDITQTNVAETGNVEAKTGAADNETKPTRRKRSKAAGYAHNAARGIAPMTYSITETCAAIGISERAYYKMPENERPPKVQFGARVLHPVEGVKRWLIERMQ
jgi:hypothetical protein